MAKSHESKARFVKGSPEAKEYMRQLRERAGTKPTPPPAPVVLAPEINGFTGASQSTFGEKGTNFYGSLWDTNKQIGVFPDGRI